MLPVLPSPCPDAADAPDAPLPYISYNLCWSSGLLPGSKSKVRFLDSSDRIIFTAHHRRVNGRPVIEFFSPQAEKPTAALLPHTQSGQYTLRVPNLPADPGSEIEILGLAWDATRDGRALPVLRMLLYYGETPHVAATRAERLGCMAYREAAPPGAIWFRSKAPGAKKEHIEAIPAFAPDSRKNVVMVDAKGVVVLRMYKVAEGTVRMYSVPFLGPIVTLACGIAVIER
jgi:hypothetical protein